MNSPGPAWIVWHFGNNVVSIHPDQYHSYVSAINSNLAVYYLNLDWKQRETRQESNTNLLRRKQIGIFTKWSNVLNMKGMKKSQVEEYMKEYTVSGKFFKNIEIKHLPERGFTFMSKCVTFILNRVHLILQRPSGWKDGLINLA